MNQGLKDRLAQVRVKFLLRAFISEAFPGMQLDSASFTRDFVSETVSMKIALKPLTGGTAPFPDLDDLVPK